MYISGTIGTFQSRLHSLPTGLSDLSGVTSFWTEGKSYTSNISTGIQYNWSREFAVKYYQITTTGIPYNLNYFAS